jgi:uncharacterized membrane protein YvlD (DUF360 family)
MSAPGATGRLLRNPFGASRVADVFRTYRSLVRPLWRWRHHPTGAARRWVVSFAIAAVAFSVAAWTVPGIEVDGVAGPAAAVAAMAIFNALVRPLLLAVAAFISALLVGLLAVALEAFALAAVAPLAPGVTVNGALPAILGSWIYGVTASFLTLTFGVDADEYHDILIRRVEVRGAARRTEVPGVVIVQVDGVSHPVIQGRIRAGQLPTIGGWLRRGSHRLTPWHPLLPTMTSASQAGILYGSNDNIPAFRWFVRDTGRIVVSSDPNDAADIARRLSDGNGLLARDGASIGNLLSGDASRSFVTAATLRIGAHRLGDSTSFLQFFAWSGRYVRSLLLFVAEFIREREHARRARFAGVWPRVDRSLRDAFRRAAGTVLLHDLNVSLVLQEMARSTAVIYVDFADYDEIAHHAGPESVDALAALDDIDVAVGTIAAAAAVAPRPYRFVVLSDHGQTLGATFSQRYGETLSEVVASAIGGPCVVIDAPRAASRSAADRAACSVDASAAIVLGSGNLGLVYLRGSGRRLTLEELEARYPSLVAGLLRHPGIGLLLVRSAVYGPVLLGPAGRHYLGDGVVEGQDPALPYGRLAVPGLAREDGMADVPDILVLSRFDPAAGDAAAFEELVGFHGGLGGPQGDAFVVHPSDWLLDRDPLVGADRLHENLRRWLENAGTLPPARAAAKSHAVTSDG